MKGVGALVIAFLLMIVLATLFATHKENSPPTIIINNQREKVGDGLPGIQPFMGERFFGLPSAFYPSYDYPYYTPRVYDYGGWNYPYYAYDYPYSGYPGYFGYGYHDGYYGGGGYGGTSYGGKYVGSSYRAAKPTHLDIKVYRGQGPVKKWSQVLKDQQAAQKRRRRQ